MLIPANGPTAPETPLVRRYRCGISLMIGIGLLVVASITALNGHYVPCGVLLTAGAHFINHALGWPTLLDALLRAAPLIPTLRKESSQLPAAHNTEPPDDDDHRARHTG